MAISNYYVYILANKGNNVLYIGVTNNPIRRIWEYKEKVFAEFPARYNVNKLVCFETTDLVEAAILREKQLKVDSRNKKLQLILKENPEYNDLYGEIAAVA